MVDTLSTYLVANMAESKLLHSTLADKVLQLVQIYLIYTTYIATHEKNSIITALNI